MKFTMLSALLLLSLGINAQQYTDEPKKESEEVKSLFNKGNEITGFGNLDFRISSIKDAESLIIGAYGGVLINRSVMLGLAGYGISSKVEIEGLIPNTNTPSNLNVYGGYGGIVLGIMVASKEVIHLSFPIILAAGNLDVSDDNYFANISSDKSYVVESSKFFVIEPSALLELNISKVFRIGLGGGYRFVRALELENINDEDMSNFSGVLSFKFGGF